MRLVPRWTRSICGSSTTVSYRRCGGGVSVRQCSAAERLLRSRYDRSRKSWLPNCWRAGVKSDVGGRSGWALAAAGGSAVIFALAVSLVAEHVVPWLVSPAIYGFLALTAGLVRPKLARHRLKQAMALNMSSNCQQDTRTAGGM
jgi:hypothetical protein